MKNPPADMNAPVFQFMQALGYAEKPVVAAVNGAAVGIGTTMLMHCDLVYCADNSVFSMPFVSLGLCPEFASSLLIPLNAGYHKAVEKLLLAEPISARRSARYENRQSCAAAATTFSILRSSRLNASTNCRPLRCARPSVCCARDGKRSPRRSLPKKPTCSGRWCAAQRRKKPSRRFLNAGSRTFRSLLDLNPNDDDAVAVRSQSRQPESRTGDNLPGWFGLKVVDVSEGRLAMEVAHQAAVFGAERIPARRFDHRIG